MEALRKELDKALSDLRDKDEQLNVQKVQIQYLKDMVKRMEGEVQPPASGGMLESGTKAHARTPATHLRTEELPATQTYLPTTSTHTFAHM